MLTGLLILELGRVLKAIRADFVASFLKTTKLYSNCANDRIGLFEGSADGNEGFFDDVGLILGA